MSVRAVKEILCEIVQLQDRLNILSDCPVLHQKKTNKISFMKLLNVIIGFMFQFLMFANSKKMNSFAFV